ncbi:MAG: DUF3301 domain-containing protein [Rhodanobacteraceae bacterium]
MFGPLISLVLMATTVCLWMAALRARELAVHFGHVLCRRAGVQLLDQSVSLQRLRLRLIDGRLHCCRRYSFELSINGDDRHRGYLDLRGEHLETWSLPWLTDDALEAFPQRLDPPSSVPDRST